MPAIEQDLKFIHIAAEELENFLLSGEVFWTIDPIGTAKGKAYPSRLSVGQILLALARIKAYPLSADISTDYHRSADRIQQIRSQWRATWDRKIGLEFPHRMRSWQQFWDEFSRDRRGAAFEYPIEVRIRTILALLEAEADSIPGADEARLGHFDQLLKSVFTLGEFIWDKTLVKSFPQPDFWFLYGTINP